jgi:hypothetical protein
MAEGLELQRRFDKLGDSDRTKEQAQYGSDSEIDQNDQEFDFEQSSVSGKSKAQNYLKLGRECNLSSSRLLKPKQIKRDHPSSNQLTKAKPKPNKFF